MKPPNSARVRDGVVAAGVALVAWGVYRFFNPAPANPTDGDAGHVEPSGEDIRPATFTEAQAVGLADALFAALYLYWFGEDEETVVRILKTCLVTADVRLLVNAYGRRSTLLTVDASLPEAVVHFLDTADIDDINADYIAKSIRYRF